MNLLSMKLLVLATSLAAARRLLQQEEYQDYESNEDTGGESNSEEDTEIGEFFQPPEKKVYSLSINYTSQYTLHLRDIKHVSE